MRKFAILWCLLLLGLSSARYMVKRQAVEDESSESTDTDNLINDEGDVVSDMESDVSENEEGEANDVSGAEGGDSEEGSYEEEAGGGENDVSDNAQENEDRGDDSDNYIESEEDVSENEDSDLEEQTGESDVAQDSEDEDEGGEGDEADDSNNNLQSEIKGDELEEEDGGVGDVSEEEDGDSEEDVDADDVLEMDDGNSVEETTDEETHESDVVQDIETQDELLGVDINGESNVDATEEETDGDNIDDAQGEGLEGGEDDDSNNNYESEIKSDVVEEGSEDAVSESNENEGREENADSEDTGVESEGGDTKENGDMEDSYIGDIASDTAEANEIQSDEIGDVEKGPGYQPEAGDVEEAESDEPGKEREDIGDAEDEEPGAPQAIAVYGGIDFLENKEDEDSNESETPEAMEALDEANPEMEAELLTPEEQDKLLKEEESKAKIANEDGGTEQDDVGVNSQAEEELEEEREDQEQDDEQKGKEQEEGNGENEVANDLLDSLNEDGGEEQDDISVNSQTEKEEQGEEQEDQEQEEVNGENDVANDILDSLNEDDGAEQNDVSVNSQTEEEEQGEGDEQTGQEQEEGNGENEVANDLLDSLNEDGGEEQDDVSVNSQTDEEEQEGQEEEQEDQEQEEVNGENDVANDILDSLNEDDGAEQNDAGVNSQEEEENQEEQEQHNEQTEQEQDHEVNGENETEEGRRRRKRDVNTRPPVSSLFPSTAYVKNSFVTVKDAKPVPKSAGRRKRFILPSEYNRWDRGIVPFEFDAVFNTPQSQFERRACMLKYQTQTCIRFVQNDKDTKSKYGLTHDGVMEHVLKGGCWSIQGNSRRHQTVNCCGKPLCLHELGHTLGLVHEHQSALRKGWIRVNWENIKPAQKRAFVDQMSSPLSSMVGYDITSDMHYNMNTFSVNGKPVMSQLYSGPYLRVKNTDFYAYKEVSLGHKCGETYCASADFQCVNEGYLTLVRDECVCACPTGLEAASGCADVKKKAVMKQWPGGTYSILRPENGCPEGLKEGKVVVHSTKSYNSNLWHLGSGYDGTKTEIQVCTSDEDNKSEVPWEPGVYCILRKGGKCPAGFTESFIQYGETTAPETTGAVPDGVFEQQTRLFFCCRSDGFQDLAVRLPNTVPFALVSHSGTCQIIEGMGHQEEFFVVQNKPAATVDGFGFPTNVEHPKVTFNPNYGTIRLAVCYYYPLNIGCGKIIDLDHSNPSVTITSPGYPENYPDKTECNWLIKGPEHLTIKIDFDEFEVEGTSTCHDYLEIRQNRMGQAGIKYCGSQLGTTIVSVYNNISLTFRSNSAVSKKGFKATVKLIQDEDYVYDPLNKGRTYRGKVNITHAFELCLPWSQVTHCEHHPLRPGDFEDDLIENYCRNPNDGIMPWCYTATSDCSRNYCDVSKIGKMHNSYDDCDDVIKEDPDFCQRDTALSGCALACSGGGGSAEKEKSYLDVSCPAPEILEDAEIKSGKKDEYREADVITYKCKTEDLEYKSFCLTDGTWSPVGYVCGGCPYEWAEYKKGCYKYFGIPVKRVAAEQICKEHGATLTTVVDQAEEDFVISIRETMHKVMIGLEKKDGKWVWPDGNVTEWLPWQAPPYDRYDFKYASLLGQDKGRKWVATNGYWPEDFVCKRATKKHVLCKDRLKNCEDIMAALPQSCQNGGWARSECPVSCNICEVSGKMFLDYPR
ncbi:uncharacterized protein LOC126807724 [Patella vulgata]|uniref:uncharacterized protein LOC126807724 n=1 Tax=Patella vulgata TaxID=6465 RepID=UPI00217F27B2|nr:uncharacterized protein LOC126807724 [Patella vulgata]